jgi:hypothetical protein
MTKLDELLALRGSDLDRVAEATGADLGDRKQVSGYQNLTGVDAIEAPGGATVYARGNDVALIYAGPDALGDGVTNADLVQAVGSNGTQLDSRQGKTATLHVVPEEGVAWSEDGGEVAFVELFPATDLDTYKSTIYRDPGAFTR